MNIKYLLLCLFYFYSTVFSQVYTDKQIKKLYEEFFYNVERGNLSNVKEFLSDEKTFPVDFRHPDGYTALQLAVVKKNIDMVEYLIKKGANLAIKYPVTNQRCVFGKEVSFSAPNVDSVDVIELAILSAKYAKDTVIIKYIWDRFYKGMVWYDKLGNTLLHIAMFSKCSVDYWLNSTGYNFLGFISRTCNINPNSLNFNGQNALNYYLSQPGGCTDFNYNITYCNSPSEIVFEAQRAGIDVEAKDNFGKNYISYLKEFKHEKDIEHINSKKEFQRVIAILKKFRETDFEEMWRRNDEAFQKHLEELKEYQNRQVSYSSSGGCKEKCPVCFGFGSGEQRAYTDVCPECNGRGNLGYSKSVISGYNHDYTYFSPNTCWKCNGTGVRVVYENQPCKYCNGTGCLVIK